MEYMELCNGMQMPMLGFGTWAIRGTACIESVVSAIACGYRMLDTAIMYENEKEVGQGIRESGIKREEIFLTSKLNQSCNSYEKARDGIQRSLDRMGVAYADLFLVHEPYEESLEMYRALCEAYESGRVKAIGVSNFNQRRLETFLKECGILPAVNQIEAHIFYPQLELVSYLRKQGIAAQAWGPLAQGQEGIFDNPILQSIGKKHEKTTAQVALRFLVQSGISVVPKTTREVRMKENMDIFDFRLTEAEMREILALDKKQTLSPWTEHWK